jgi:hypothetical protein
MERSQLTYHVLQSVETCQKDLGHSTDTEFQPVDKGLELALYKLLSMNILESCVHNCLRRIFLSRITV